VKKSSLYQIISYVVLRIAGISHYAHLTDNVDVVSIIDNPGNSSNGLILVLNDPF
jgi:hypothetical protein